MNTLPNDINVVKKLYLAKANEVAQLKAQLNKNNETNSQQPNSKANKAK